MKAIMGRVILSWEKSGRWNALYDEEMALYDYQESWYTQKYKAMKTFYWGVKAPHDLPFARKDYNPCRRKP